MVKQYGDYTLAICYDMNCLSDAYHFILEGWDGWEELRRLMPVLEEQVGWDWVVEYLSRIVRPRQTGREGRIS